MPDSAFNGEPESDHLNEVADSVQGGFGLVGLKTKIFVSQVFDIRRFGLFKLLVAFEKALQRRFSGIASSRGRQKLF